jgi:hypothetical protein
MGFFEDLGKKIGSATDSAADKARRAAEISKLRSQIGAEEKNIEKTYYEIGKKTFETDRDDPDSPVRALCDSILKSQERIRALQSDIAALKAPR